MEDYHYKKRLSKGANHQIHADYSNNRLTISIFPDIKESERRTVAKLLQEILELRMEQAGADRFPPVDIQSGSSSVTFRNPPEVLHEIVLDVLNTLEKQGDQHPVLVVARFKTGLEAIKADAVEMFNVAKLKTNKPKQTAPMHVIKDTLIGALTAHKAVPAQVAKKLVAALAPAMGVTLADDIEKIADAAANENITDQARKAYAAGVIKDTLDALYKGEAR